MRETIFPPANNQKLHVNEDSKNAQSKQPRHYAQRAARDNVRSRNRYLEVTGANCSGLDHTTWINNNHFRIHRFVQRYAAIPTLPHCSS